MHRIEKQQIKQNLESISLIAVLTTIILGREDFKKILPKWFLLEKH